MSIILLLVMYSFIKVKIDKKYNERDSAERTPL
jgi:hypothetical protein